MEKQTLTFLLASNQKGVVKRFVIPSSWMRAGVAALAISFIILSVAFVDYVGLLFQSIEVKKLKSENAHLKDQFQIVESKLDGLEKGLDRIKSFSTKLKLITNTEDPDRTLKLSIGAGKQVGGTDDDTNEPLDKRGPVQNMIDKMTKEDSLFLENPPLDGSYGELAVESRQDYASLSIRIDQLSKEASMREQGILELWESLVGRQSILRATPSLVPVRGWLSSRFGYRVSPYTGRPVMHQGLDIAGSPGSPVYAPADGIISFAGYNGSYGKLVAIDHGYGVTTRYGHNSQIFVVVGQKIKRGDVICAVGNTGHSTGPHLHYEVRINDVPVDPINYILNE